jgi:hypothetical protein
MATLTSDIPKGYVVGLGRDPKEPPIAHLYKGTFNNPGLPMCRFGWNRDEGFAYSIWRGNAGKEGICDVCLRRARAGKKGVQPKKRRIVERW